MNKQYLQALLGPVRKLLTNTYMCLQFLPSQFANGGLELLIMLFDI